MISLTQKEAESFFREYVGSSELFSSNSNSSNAQYRRVPGYNLDDLTCINEISFRYDPNTPLTDFECPNGQEFMFCWNSWTNCVNTAADDALFTINFTCVAAGTGAITLTTTVGTVVPGVGTAVGFLVGLANGTAAFIFCAEETIDNFNENACPSCQTSFDGCCVF